MAEAQTSGRVARLSELTTTYRSSWISKFILKCALTNLPPIPSLFTDIPDSLEYSPRPVLQFLHHVSWEMSQPVVRDGREHIEYVPTQAVTEFVRTRRRVDGKVDGIKYPSAVGDGSVSYLLFAEQENTVLLEGQPGHPGESKRWLERVQRGDRLLTEDEVTRWQSECVSPPPNFADERPI